MTSVLSPYHDSDGQTLDEGALIPFQELGWNEYQAVHRGKPLPNDLGRVVTCAGLRWLNYGQMPQNEQLQKQTESCINANTEL